MRVIAIALLFALTGPEDLSRLERRMLELINIEREARAIPKLKLSEPLAEVGRAYSRRMAETGEVHHRLDRPMEERIREALPHTCLFGENVSKHTSVDYSLGDLMLSPGHRKNLLHPDYTLIGIGIVRGEDGFLYITQDFARPCGH
jgi:uncharacterized protein YkwD